MVDDRMEEVVGIHLVVEAKDAPWEEEACLEAGQAEVVRWVEWEGGLMVVLRMERG